MSEDIIQRNAQYCKKYYSRKKSANQGVVKKKTNSEKCRQYRQRKKLLAQQLQSKNEVIHTPSTSSLQMTFEPQLITTVTMPRGKRQNSKTDKRDRNNKINFETSTAYNEHEEDQYFSTTYNESALAIKRQGIKQKLLIANNIIIACKEEKMQLQSQIHLKPSAVPYLKRVHNFTNLPEEELKEINESVKTRDRSFSKALKDVRIIRNPTAGFISDDIRSLLVNHIVERKMFPSKADLLKELKPSLKKYSNETMAIQRLVRNKLIKYQHFPSFKRYLLLEHPERAYQRGLYLNRVKEYRSQGKTFVYVEIKKMTPRTSTYSFIVGLAAFPSSNQVEKFFTKDSGDLIAKKWLQQRVLPLIPANAVVVLIQPIISDGTKIDIQSNRSELKSWLDENRIAYPINGHTAELYKLYTTFQKHVKPMEAYDHVFLNAGIEFVQYNGEWRKLKFFRKLWADVEIIDNYHTERTDLLKQKILNEVNTMTTELEEIETGLVEDEYKIMMEDEKMDEIVENVLEMAKNNDVAGVFEFPNCYGDKTDWFETYVCNYVR